MIKRGRKLDPAARHIGVGRRRLDGSVGSDRVRSLAHRNAIGGDEASRDCGLRPRAAFEQAARHQQAIGAFSGGHRDDYFSDSSPRKRGPTFLGLKVISTGFPPTRGMSGIGQPNCAT